MSSPNDLKNILIDAARYRWARENIESLIYEFTEKIGGGDELHPMVDAYVDAELNHG